MDPELSDLLAAWFGEEVDEARRDALLARLRTDAAFREAVARELWMLGTLKAVQSAEPRWLRIEDEVGWSAGRCAEEEAGGTGFVPEATVPAGVPSRRGWWLVAVTAVAAVLIVAGLSLTPWSRGRREGRDPGRPAHEPVASDGKSRMDQHAPTVNPRAERPFPEVPAAEKLAIIINLDHVRWAVPDAPHPSEGDFLPAGWLRLLAGRVTLSMLSGVTLTVEGPAELELSSMDKVFCRHGKLRALVPTGAEGFIVEGPGSAVVDHGTEFGVNIKDEGTAIGKVFKGEIEAAVTDTSGIIQRSQVIGEQGQVFKIDPRTGRIDVIETSSAFAVPAKITVPRLILDPSYPQVIAASRPWGYWRFESLQGDLVPNEVPGRPPLRARGPIRLDGPAEGGRCAVFRPGARQQYLSLDNPWEPPRARGFAVEVWFLTESIRYATLASLVAPRDSRNHVFLLELTSRDRFGLYQPASVRALHRWPAARSGGDSLFAGCYIPYHWHHLISQVRDGRMELYLDGMIASSLSVISSGGTVPCQFLLGELTTLGLPNPGASRPFGGRMDEVALYDHPLSAEEIRHHYRLAAGKRPAD